MTKSNSISNFTAAAFSISARPISPGAQRNSRFPAASDASGSYSASGHSTDASQICSAAALRSPSAWALLLAGIFFGSGLAARAQSAPPEIIGGLSGDDVSLKSTPNSAEHKIENSPENGRAVTPVASGSDVTVRSGHARIELTDGGDIDVCGPAHLSLFKTGGAITVALDFGRVHPHVDSGVSINIFTPQIVATPVAIGRNSRDITIGLDKAGEMCALASRGALRIEQQLSGQSLLVPEGAETSLSGGQLNPLPAASVNCTCEVPIAQTRTPPSIEFSVPASPSDAKSENAATVPPPPAPAPSAEPPIYRVDVPPLTFASNSPNPPPDPDPQTMLLVRQSRVEDGTVFEGHVSAAPATPGNKKSSDAASPSPDSAAESRKPGIFARIFGFFHK